MGRKYLALGDSYTIGEAVAADQRWPVQLVDLLNRREFRFDPPEIIATTGWTTDELAAAMDAKYPVGTRADFDLVSLLIGVNNQYRGRPLDEYREQFSALLERALALAGDDPQRVLVLAIPDWGVTPFGAKSGRDTA
ncbi:MAG: GDSL-type esterase/lipase family protein, partial [Aquimonas sp.]